MLQRLGLLTSLLWKAGLTINVKKSKFYFKRLKYLDTSLEKEISWWTHRKFLLLLTILFRKSQLTLENFFVFCIRKFPFLQIFVTVPIVSSEYKKRTFPSVNWDKRSKELRRILGLPGWYSAAFYLQLFVFSSTFDRHVTKRTSDFDLDRRSSEIFVAN